MNRVILVFLATIVLSACTSSKYIEERHAWWESELTNIVRQRVEKSEVVEFLKKNGVSNTYVENENAFYIAEREAHKWIIGYTDLMVRIYLDQNDVVKSYKVEEVHTSL